MFNDRKRYLLKVHGVIDKCLTNAEFFVKKQFGNRMVNKFRAEGTILGKVLNATKSDRLVSLDHDSEAFFKRK
jgi:hypothetical protein